ncbi:hypothetical protein [Aeromicrobium sp. Root236]|uniref:hypothetical protein n=1 Tax=Aeromicrobium sp. Root236 TaxID=1736498 RepID=UPI000A72EBD2|nr:hypothetical protein [Aeromicrobium sp. Root236]
MNQIILVTVLVLAFAAVVVELVRTLRGDGYGVRPPPRSHREEVDLRSPYRSLV